MAGCQGPSATGVQPHALFTDHAVLQRDRDIVVWGTADPGGTVEVELGEAEVQVPVDERGQWQATLPPMEAGGPYELEIEGVEATTFKNIMIGDVWIASGQSNMEWALQSEVDNFEEEIANADFPDIRLFTVDHNVSFVPLDSMPVVGDGWQPTSPETIPNFSAVAYFFGRQVHQDQGVPVGLLSTNWGGTPAEAWTSESALMTMPEFKAVLEERKNADEPAKDPAEQEKRRASFVAAANQKIEAADFQPNYDTENWPTMKLPNAWEQTDTTLQNLDGFVWFQKTINLPAQYAKQDLTLSLGAIDDMDVTWFNGQRIGDTDGYNVMREYTVPAALTQSGENTITVRVQDNGGGGGLTGPAEKMYLAAGGEQLPVEIGGSWRYDTTQEGDFPPVREIQHEPAALYNAMIAPLLPFPIKGVIWYQGENNTNRAKQYATLFPKMIQDWRQQWGYDFPFLYVQLANFQAGGAPDGWAYLREAQNKALELENTGVAVTIDIGDSSDIHPRNKLDVGDRLATAARTVAYGDASVFTGPMYQSMRVSGDSIIVTFKGVGDGLMKLPDEDVTGFMIAGEDQRFTEAQANIISPNEVSVFSFDVATPVAVRYGWSNNPKVNLYNEDGLPVSPFRTDDWKPMDVTMLSAAQ